MGKDLLINWRVVKSTVGIASVLTAGSLLCTLIVMAFEPSGGEHVVLALSLAILVPLVCATPVALFVASQSEKLAELNARLAHDASHDSLTELPNRRVMFDALERHLDLGAEASVLLIDIDRFKQVNDGHGHHTGDEALKALARLFTSEVPAEALVARLGGEEFAVLLPGVSLAVARALAEHLRRSVEAFEFSSPDGVPCPLTVSIGIDQLREEFRLFPLRGADSALYAAKADGRNRVSFYATPAKRPSEKAA